MDTRPRPVRRRGLWGALGWLSRGPVNAFNGRDVVEGAHTVGRLADALRAEPRPDPRVRVRADGTLDMTAIAASMDKAEADVERMLQNRRQQSRVAAYCYLLGGVGSLLFWVYEALLRPVTPLNVLGLTGACAVFFLAAFYHALVNWQVRTHRLGTAREFLATEESWWPS